MGENGEERGAWESSWSVSAFSERAEFYDGRNGEERDAWEK